MPEVLGKNPFTKLLIFRMTSERQIEFDQQTVALMRQYCDTEATAIRWDEG
jgi:hypothetical protein